MNKSKIGYYTIGEDGEPTHTYYGWNPFGYGCSAGCPGCWARQLAKRVGGAGCPDCKAFVPHIHPERLDQPAKRKKPSLVLCNFTSDWLDPAMPRRIAACIRAMGDAPQHKYITLTKHANWAFGWTGEPEAYHGLTIRNQAEADAKLGDFLSVPGNLWISAEPLQGEVNWLGNDDGLLWPLAEVVARHALCGIITGHDNRRGAPGTETTDHIRSTVEQCKAAGVPCFVKQIWVEQIAKPCTATRTGRTKFAWKLLRASHPPEYALYPDWAKDNRLPWEAVT